MLTDKLSDAAADDDNDDDDSSIFSAAYSTDSESDELFGSADSVRGRSHPDPIGQVKSHEATGARGFDCDVDDDPDVSDALNDSGVGADANFSFGLLPAFSFRSALDLLMAPFLIWP